MSPIRRFFRFGRHSMQQASVLLIVTSLLSNGLGLARNLIFYRLLQPSQFDVYNASFRLSDLVYNLLVFGAISTALVPVVGGLLHAKEEREAHTLIDQLITWSIVTFATIGAILFFVMPEIARLVVPHFDALRTAEFIRLSRIMLLQPIIFSVSFIVGSLLNGYRRFSAYSLAPLTYNLAIIVGGLLSPRFGIQVITWTVVIGAALHLAIQYSEAFAAGYRLRPNFGFNGQTREVVRLMVPRSLAQGFAQLVPTAYTNLASGLIPGSISVFTGINDIQTTPTVVIANSLATATFPALTAYAHDGDQASADQLLTKLLRTTLFAMVPIVALGLILRAQLVRLYIGIGHYGWQLTDQGIALLAWFLIGMIPASLIVLLSRVFYANKDSRTPLLISVIGNGLAIVTAILLIRYERGTVSSFGAAEAASSLLQCALYFGLAHRRGYIRLPVAQLVEHVLNYLVGALVLLWAAWASLQAVAAFYLRIGHPGYTGKIIGLFAQTVVAGAIGALAYFGYSTFRSNEELRWLKRRAFTNGK